MTWAPLLITLGLLTICLIYAYYISVFKPKDLLPKEKGYTFSEFIVFAYLGRKDNWTAIFYKFPKDITAMFFPFNSDSFNAFIAVFASEALSISTKPIPLDLPVSRSLTAFAETTLPRPSNASLNA